MLFTETFGTNDGCNLNFFWYRTVLLKVLPVPVFVVTFRSGKKYCGSRGGKMTDQIRTTAL